MEKTIAYLKEKAWYRFFKVIYIAIFVLIMLLINGMWFFEENFKYAFNFLLADVSIVFLFYLVRGAFYYIAIGKFNPKK